MTDLAGGGAVHPLSEVLRRYSFAYTAAHDFSVCPSVMIDDYELLMGPFEAKGRDTTYIPATEKQYRQYPGLGFTVHDLINNGDRAALRFSEYGRSVLTGRSSSWRGISLYQWDGRRLTQCRVEQDYQSRTRQIDAGQPDRVPAPALDPWTTTVEPADPAVEAALRAYLTSSQLLTNAQITVDAEDVEPTVPRMELDEAEIELLDLFTAGHRAAVHLHITGAYRSGLGSGFQELVGTAADLYASGILTLADEGTTGHLVTDRLAAGRRLRAARPTTRGVSA